MSQYSNFKLFTRNYVDLEVLANSDVSSQQTAFPVTNAYNLNRRSRVWRSNGHFEVKSGENTIVFNEGGSDLTATVTPGHYASTALFMAAVDAALTGAPGAAGSYTVTHNSEFKFVITKSAGTFNIKWSDSGSTEMAAVLGFDDGFDSTGALSYTADLLRINTDEWILWDLGIASNPTAFLMCDQRNRPIRLSPGGIFTLEGNETNNFSMPSYSKTLTYDDQAIAVINDDGLHTGPLRYWRIRFQDQNPLGYIQIGAFFLGESFSPGRGRVQFPFSAEYIDRSEVVVSEGGQSFGDVFEQTESYNPQWLGLQEEDIELLDDIFRKYGTVFPFFVSMDTAEAYSTKANRRIKFVRFSQEPKYTLESPHNFACQMELLEQL